MIMLMQTQILIRRYRYRDMHVPRTHFRLFNHLLRYHVNMEIINIPINIRIHVHMQLQVHKMGIKTWTALIIM